MAERGDEVEAAVNSVVNDVSAIKTALVMEVALELVVDVADNGAETRGQKYPCFRRTAGCNSSSRRQSQVLPLLC